MSDFPIRFEHPGWLLLLLLVPLAWWLARRGAGTLSPSRRWISLSLRGIVIVLLAAALAEPSWVKRSDDLAVIVVADTSRSVPPDLLLDAESFLKAAADARDRPEDRLALVTVAKRAEVAALPEASTVLSFGGHAGADEATNLAEGVRMALAIVPKDAAARIVLVSDGNETEDRVAEAADLARANGVPIDVLPIEVRVDGEVVFEELQVPTRARKGQTVELRMFLRSARPTVGRLSLLHDELRVDLDPRSPSDTMLVSLEAGENAFSVSLPLGSSGPHRFRAVFEPVDPAADAVVENNTATGVTFVSGEGRVLILDAGSGEGAPLAAVLRERGLEVERRSVEQLAGDAAIISRYDAVVLANLPRWAIDVETDRFLASYVHDLGGGLLMMGGDRSFGAGGWIDSETAKAIPVQMDPPVIKQVLRASIALVIDRSGSMSQAMAGTGRSRQEIANGAASAGIRSMHDLDELSVIAFDSAPERLVPRRRVGEGGDELSLVSSIGAGGGTDQFAAMELALEELRGSRAISRHMIVLTDGQTVGDPEHGVGIARSAGAEGISVTTIAIGDDANVDLLERIAEAGDGRFFAIRDAAGARVLPEIFIREASIGGRNLIVEGEPFVPSMVPESAGPLRSVRSVPPLRGYVLTTPREGFARASLQRRTEQGVDPIYAWWNHGTGRAIAFTSDFSGRWGREWLSWADAASFWEESLRWLLRPAAPEDLMLLARIEGDEGVVEVASLDAGGAGRGFLRAEGRVVAPDGTVTVLPLRQSGPGRVAGRFPLAAIGSYLVSVALPGDGGVRGMIQGAVTVPHAREHRAIRDDAALLRTVAERTGGRVLAMSDPRLANLFLREEISVPLAPRGVWDLLALAALLLFLLDVAVRRVSLDPREWLEAMGSLAGRRGEPSEGAVEAWQRARARGAEIVLSSEGAIARAASVARPTERAVAGPSRAWEEPEDAGPRSSGETSSPSTPNLEHAPTLSSRLLRARRADRRGQDEP